MTAEPKPVVSDGPSLETYVETRFNMLTDAIGIAVEQMRREAVLIREETDRHFELVAEKFSAYDLRYEQRYVSQQEAIAARDERLAAISLERLTGLREHFTSLEKSMSERFTANSVLQDSQQDAMKEAVLKSERATEIRFESVNEFRQTLTDQAAGFMTKAAFDEAQKASQVYRDTINSRIDILTSRMNIREGQADGSRETKDNTRANWSMVVAVSAVAITVLLALIPLLGNRHDAPASPLLTTPPGYKLVPQ